MNAAREIANCLQEVRENLERLDIGIEAQSEDLELREGKNIRNDAKIDQLVKNQKEIIFFNISGKLCPCNLQTILDFEYDNVLKEICKSLISSGKLDDLQNITIDRNRKVFKMILDLIRKSDDKKRRVSSFYDNVDRIEYIINPDKVNYQVFREEMAYYFKGDVFDKIFEDFKITYYTDKTRSVSKVMRGNNLNPTLFIQSFDISAEFPNELLQPYKTKKIDDIRAADSFFKAIFTDYDSNVIFNFSEPVKVRSIELKPFWADLDVWFPGDGANSIVYYSLDKTNWEFLTMVPDSYGSDIGLTYIMQFEEKELMYLKFELKEYPISISYIKLG